MSLQLSKFLLSPSFHFRNVVTRNPCHFDFLLFIPHGKISVAAVIEYDGEQHFQIVERFHGTNPTEAQANFEKQQRHDITKNQYTRAHKISLLRIAYSDQHRISEIVTKFVTSVQNSSSRVDMFSDKTRYINPYGPESSWCIIM